MSILVFHLLSSVISYQIYFDCWETKTLLSNGYKQRHLSAKLTNDNKNRPSKSLVGPRLQQKRFLLIFKNSNWHGHFKSWIDQHCICIWKTIRLKGECAVCMQKSLSSSSVGKLWTIPFQRTNLSFILFEESYYTMMVWVTYLNRKKETWLEKCKQKDMGMVRD